MKNLQEATERICELKGDLLALDALVPAIANSLDERTRASVLGTFETHAEAARTVMLHADISDVVLATFERHVASIRALLQPERRHDIPAPARDVADALLLTTTRITTFAGSCVLTGASGFFFRSGTRLFLVSNRHVFADAASAHLPDRIEIGLHTNGHDLTQHVAVSLPLYVDGSPQWREAPGEDGSIDVAALAIPHSALPESAMLQAFDESHLEVQDEDVRVGDALAIVGFPLGFHDTVHFLPVVRSASIASAFGVRFQREACFLTDARTHRGSSGSPVVRRRARDRSTATPLPWQLLGVHSSRMDMRTRDHAEDESLGLNCAWYADALKTLTARE